MIPRLDLIAVAVLTVLVLVLIGVLLVLQNPVPDQLYQVLAAGVGALSMAARPSYSVPPAVDR